MRKCHSFLHEGARPRLTSSWKNFGEQLFRNSYVSSWLCTPSSNTRGIEPVSDATVHKRFPRLHSFARARHHLTILSAVQAYSVSSSPCHWMQTPYGWTFGCTERQCQPRAPKEGRWSCLLLSTAMAFMCSSFSRNSLGKPHLWCRSRSMGYALGSTLATIPDFNVHRQFLSSRKTHEHIGKLPRSCVLGLAYGIAMSFSDCKYKSHVHNLGASLTLTLSGSIALSTAYLSAVSHSSVTNHQPTRVRQIRFPRDRLATPDFRVLERLLVHVPSQVLRGLPCVVGAWALQLHVRVGQAHDSPSLLVTISLATRVLENRSPCYSVTLSTNAHARYAGL